MPTLTTRTRGSGEPRRAGTGEISRLARALRSRCGLATSGIIPERVPPPNGRGTAGFDEAGPALFRARYGVLPERPGDTHIELGWSDGRTSVDRDIEIAIELLCDHLSVALERLEGEPQASDLAKVVNLRG